jgi:protein gp37
MKRYGRDVWGPGAKRERTSVANWKKPILWNKQARESGKRRLVFCASLADAYEDNPQVEDWRAMLFRLIEETPSLTWLLLTKRPENIFTFGIPSSNNFWMGTTAENQEMYDKRAPILAVIDAPVRFVSVEPQLSRIDMFSNPSTTAISGLIDWVIVGGESGANCRPFNPKWARLLLRECQETGAAFFMKQLGGYPNKRHEMTDFPDDLKVREFPR